MPKISDPSQTAELFVISLTADTVSPSVNSRQDEHFHFRRGVSGMSRNPSCPASDSAHGRTPAGCDQPEDGDRRQPITPATRRLCGAVQNAPRRPAGVHLSAYEHVDQRRGDGWHICRHGARSQAERPAPVRRSARPDIEHASTIRPRGLATRPANRQPGASTHSLAMR